MSYTQLLSMVLQNYHLFAPLGVNLVIGDLFIERVLPTTGL